MAIRSTTGLCYKKCKSQEELGTTPQRLPHSKDGEWLQAFLFLQFRDTLVPSTQGPQSGFHFCQQLRTRLLFKGCLSLVNSRGFSSWKVPHKKELFLTDDNEQHESTYLPSSVGIHCKASEHLVTLTAGKYSSHVSIYKIILVEILPSLEMGTVFFLIFNYGSLPKLLQNKSKKYQY